jgi:hypothetical protein
MTTPAAFETPQQAGDFWVYPTIDEIIDGAVLAHVAIAVDEADVLRAEEVSVELTAGGRVLDVAEAPPDGVLPVIRMVGANAYAHACAGGRAAQVVAPWALPYRPNAVCLSPR